LLMPYMDGIETIKRLKHSGYKGGIVLLSQVTDKSMVSSAYNIGVEFYITKPINKIEVIHVLKKVLNHYHLESKLTQIKETLEVSDEEPTNIPNASMPADKENKMQEAEQILMSLGVLNNSGSQDILEAVRILTSCKGEEALSRLQNLKLLYQEISNNYQDRNIELSKSVKAIERRIRRIIEYALTNLAALGIDDYHHPKFERFSYHFFDFTELRKEMFRLQGEDRGQPKVNVKKFLEGMLKEINN